MEASNIKRGIYFQNRLWDTKLGKRFKDLNIWRGSPVGKITFLGLLVVFIINLFICSAIFTKNVTMAFSSSVFLGSIAGFLQRLNIIDKVHFFSTLSVICLSFSPLAIYLFVRRVAYRHELTAFLATLFYVLPNPISPKGMPLIQALLNGDGAHVVVFAFLPFSLLYYKAFLSSGIFVWGFLSILVTGAIMLTSPFAFLNLIIFLSILTVGEGFMGGFRVKFGRFLFVIISSFGLSYFWYYPSAITKIVVLESFRFAASYLWKIFPLLIPAIPIVGSISFLIFDRREKLQPFFLTVFLLIIYLLIVNVSLSNATGIFMADRYLPEFIFAKSFTVALILGFAFDFLYVKVKIYIRQKNNFMLIILFFLSFISVITYVFLQSFLHINLTRQELATRNVIESYPLGIGGITRIGIFSDISSSLAGLVSIFTLILLLYVFKRYPYSLGSRVTES